MVMRTQALVQLSDDLLAQLDERAAREGRNRSALIRDAVRAYLADDVGARTDRAIVEGYTRVPQSAHEAGWAEDAARRAVEAAETETGLTADDPVRFGPDRLLDAVLARLPADSGPLRAAIRAG